MQLKKIQIRYFPPGLNLQIRAASTSLQLISQQIDLYGINSLQNELQIQEFIQNSVKPQINPLLYKNLIQITQQIKKIYKRLTQTHQCKYNLSHTIKSHKQPLTDCCFSKYGQWFVTSSYDRTAKVWDTKTGNLLQDFKGHTNAVWTVDLSEFNQTRLVATGSLDNTVKIWANSKRLFDLLGHQAQVTKVKFNPNGHHLLSSSMDGLIKVWDLEKGLKIMDLKGHESQITTFSHNYQGDLIVTSGFSPTAIIFDLKSGKISHKLQNEHTGDINCCKFELTGQQCATGGTDGKCIIWDISMSNPMQVLNDHSAQILDLDFSLTSSNLITCSSDSYICLYDTNLFSLSHKLQGHQSDVTRVKFNPQGDFILSTGVDGIGRIWMTQTGENVGLMDGEGEVWACDVSYDGKWILMAHKNGHCGLWGIGLRDQQNPYS